MLAVTIAHPGGPEVLTPTEVPDPVPGHGEVLVEVAAAGVNHADLYQRTGNYAAPPGAPEWPGLEASGIVAAVGDGVEGVAVGDRVCALLPGGGYAERVVARAEQLLPVPDSVDLLEAAGLPEALATVWSNVVMTAQLRAGETLLVHGGSSGIGTIAIQLARALGCRVAVTAGSAAKLEACERLGADILVDYREQDFVEVVRSATEGRGADVVLDAIGGDYLDRNVAALAPHGRIVLIGNQSRTKGELDIRRLMSIWGSIHGSTLRARSPVERDRIMTSVRENAWPLVESRQVVPVIDERFPLTDARLAHERLERGGHIGKLLLVP
jgi:putative PIG3 family NAD(P)H quinone oxidoreductase